VTRLRREFDRAAKMLATFEKALSLETPADLRERFVVERVRWWLAKDQPADAASFLVDQRKSGALNTSAGPQTAAATSGELAYWQIAVELELWRVASQHGDAKLAKDLEDQTQVEVVKLEQHGNGYWAARARLDWQAARETQTYGGELAAL